MSTDPYVVPKAVIDEYRRKFEARERAEKDLIARLDGSGSGSIDIVQAANIALTRAEHETATPPPTVDDLTAACGYLDEARSMLDYIERRLIEGLRDGGQSWVQIAEALGRKGAASARLRYRKLGGRRLDSVSDTPSTARDEEG